MAVSKEEFYESINPNTFTGAEFCKSLYAFCLYDDTFLQKVMDKFESYGRGTAVKTIFSTYVSIYLHFQTEKEASAANSRRMKKEQEEHERKVKQEEWKKVKDRKGNPGWMDGMF